MLDKPLLCRYNKNTCMTGNCNDKRNGLNMEKMRPMLLSTLKGYTRQQFVKDVVAGVVVAIIALPLSIALALASGVGPEQGIYTAIVAGFVISALGGSQVQIAGPTAAFATIVAGIVARNGMDGLAAASGCHPDFDGHLPNRRPD